MEPQAHHKCLCGNAPLCVANLHKFGDANLRRFNVQNCTVGGAKVRHPKCKFAPFLVCRCTILDVHDTSWLASFYPLIPPSSSGFLRFALGITFLVASVPLVTTLK